jgi:hypothetical protein
MLFNSFTLYLTVISMAPSHNYPIRPKRPESKLSLHGYTSKACAQRN